MKLGRQLNIRMDDSLLSRLKLLADANYSTPSQVARRAIADAIDGFLSSGTLQDGPHRLSALDAASKRKLPPGWPQPTGS